MLNDGTIRRYFCSRPASFGQGQIKTMAIAAAAAEGFGASSTDHPQLTENHNVCSGTACRGHAMRKEDR